MLDNHFRINSKIQINLENEINRNIEGYWMFKKYVWLIIIEQNGRPMISCCLFKGNSHVSSYYSTTTKLSTNVYQIPVVAFFKMYILRTEPRWVSLRYYGSFGILYLAYRYGPKWYTESESSNEPKMHNKPHTIRKQ